MSNVTYTKFQVRVAVPGKSVCMCASQNLCLGDSEAVWATLLAHRVVCDKYLCQICPCLFPKQGSKQQLDSMYVRVRQVSRRELAHINQKHSQRNDPMLQDLCSPCLSFAR